MDTGLYNMDDWDDDYDIRPFKYKKWKEADEKEAELDDDSHLFVEEETTT